MSSQINFALLEETSPEFQPKKPPTELNSLLADDDIISPVSDDAKTARIRLQNEYQTQRSSFSKSKSVVNATNLFASSHLRLPR